MPTVAFNFRKIRKGNVTLKIWDVAGVFPTLILRKRQNSHRRLDRPTEVPLDVGAVL